MGDTLFYIGLIVTGLATFALLIFRIKQAHQREQIKNIPLRLEEWKTQFRTKRWYFFIAQMAGLIIAIIGLNI